LIANGGANDQHFTSKLRLGTSAYWIFVPALAASSVAIWFTIRNVQPHYLPLFIVLELSGLVPAFTGLISRALGRKVIALRCSVIVGGWYWTLAMTAFLLLLVQLSYFTVGIMIVYGIPAFIIAVAATYSINGNVGPGWALSAFGAGFLCSMIMIASMEPKPQTQSQEVHVPALDPGVLGPDILMIGKCSHQFAASREKSGYPDSLARLGPGGTGCLTQELIQGTEKGFVIRYEAGARDEAGKILGYTVSARENWPKDKESSSVFSDESGRVVFRFDGPIGKAWTTLYRSPELLFKNFLDCLGNGALRKDPDEYVRICLSNPYLYLSPSGNHEFSSQGYRLDYKFEIGDDGSASGYYMSLRPQEYGIVGIRSYLAVASVIEGGKHSTLQIFATGEDRPATTNDPLARGDETGVWGDGGLADRRN